MLKILILKNLEELADPGEGDAGMHPPHEPKKFFLTVKSYTVYVMEFFKSFPTFKIFI